MTFEPGSEDAYAKALGFLAPLVDSWTRGFQSMQMPGSQKDLFQTLAVESMLYHSLMSNNEIISVLAGIIRNISSGHSYGPALDWAKRQGRS